jgi:hypothetical protein
MFRPHLFEAQSRPQRLGHNVSATAVILRSKATKNLSDVG